MHNYNDVHEEAVQAAIQTATWLYDKASKAAASLKELLQTLTAEQSALTKVSYLVESKNLNPDAKYPSGDPSHYIASMMQDFYAKKTKLYKQHSRDHVRFTAVENRGQAVTPSLDLSIGNTSQSLMTMVKRNHSALAFELREENIDKTLHAITEYLHRLGKNLDPDYIKALIGPLSQGMYAELIEVINNNLCIKANINGVLREVKSIQTQHKAEQFSSYSFNAGVITLQYSMDFVCSTEEGMQSEEEFKRLQYYKDSDLRLNIKTTVNLDCLTHEAGNINQSDKSLIEQRVEICGLNAQFEYKSPEAQEKFTLLVDTTDIRGGYVLVN